jgi:hypothetical protein
MPNGLSNTGKLMSRSKGEARWRATVRMVPGQSAWKAIHAICFTGISLFPDEKNKGSTGQTQKKEPGKTKSLIKLEKKLENWLAQRSLAQILDWFNCIEITKVQTVMSSCRWSTESVARDRLFLKYLRVDIK